MITLLYTTFLHNFTLLCFFLVRWNSTKNKGNKEFFREKLILIQIGYRAFAKHNKKIKPSISFISTGVLSPFGNVKISKFCLFFIISTKKLRFWEERATFSGQGVIFCSQNSCQLNTHIIFTEPYIRIGNF